MWREPKGLRIVEFELSLERLLPHRPPALFVTAVAEYSDDAISCFGRIPSDHPSVCNGFAPSTMAVEMAAQAAGVLMGIRHFSQDPGLSPPRLGYLVSLRGMKLDAKAVPADRPLQIHVKLVGTFGEMAMFFVRIDLDEDCVVEGHLGVAAPSRAK